MYGVYDVSNDILRRDVYDTAEEAQAQADLLNSIPAPIRRLPRPTPHYVVREVIEDGFEELLVGLRKSYKIK